MSQPAQLVYNAIQTPDGTILQSKHRHDYVTHTDKNGKHYMVDGGTDYCRRSNNGDEISLCLTVLDPIEKIREVFTWGRNFDEKGKRLPKTEWVLLKDLTEGHLEALCTNQFSPEWTTLLFIREKQYRNLTQEELDTKATVKFNSGRGAILCEKCKTIIKVGKDANEEEMKFMRGEINHLPAKYCDTCIEKQLL